MIVRPVFALVLFGGISLPFWFYSIAEISNEVITIESYINVFSLLSFAGTLTFIAIRGYFKKRKSAFEDFDSYVNTIICVFFVISAFYIGLKYSSIQVLGPSFAAIVFFIGSDVFNEAYSSEEKASNK